MKSDKATRFVLMMGASSSIHQSQMIIYSKLLCGQVARCKNTVWQRPSLCDVICSNWTESELLATSHQLIQRQHAFVTHESHAGAAIAVCGDVL